MLLALALSCVGETDKPNTPDDSDPAVDSIPDSEAPDLCAENGWTSRAWDDAGTEDGALYSTVADATIQTTDGPVTLSEVWTGCESMLFIPDAPAQASGWPDGLWDLKKDVKGLFEDLPRNTHVFFVVTDGKEEDRLVKLDALKEYVDNAVDDDPEWWATHVHYVTEKAGKIDGAVGATLKSPNWGTGIDRFQRIRYIGSFANPERYNSGYGWFEPDIAMAANEARFYNMESKREDALDPDATLVPVFDGERVAGSTYVDVDIPSAAEMAEYDTLEIDLYMGCEGDGEYGYCPAWDYMAYLFVCAWDEADENAYEDTACQPAVAEVLGLCDDGATACSTDDDCSTDETSGTCAGYEEAISADTQAGTCMEADGTTHDGTYTCNEDGTGYDELSCSCNTELGRWITTYHREGRWVHDVSSLLPMLDGDRDLQMRFNTTGPYELDMNLRLSNQGKETRPEEMVFLYDGVSIRGGNYNEGYEEQTVAIPDDAVKVELVTVTTGHGMSAPGNCAEFCDLHHEWTINGAADPIVYDQPWVGDNFGCQTQVDDQTVPNQYGTWWYGRGGWCPGKHVDPVVTDITDMVTPGEDMTVDYANYYNGSEYSGDNWSHTILTSWIVISR
ncbi:MAG: hypothetical protein GY884_12015 [Proteobacteria bacterium]|nr:hypothetical protein [Pseudomonadota bacterium]